jgi:hypothetical protein
MPEPIASLAHEILRAPPAVLAAVAVLLVLIGLLLARRGAGEDDDLETAARRWIGDRIDEHVDALAEAYGEAGLRADPDELPPGFAMRIELFIAEVLLRELDAEGFDVELRAAVREFAVLHRAKIYEDVTNRTRKALAAA